ncbi:MAG TPA: methyltransferase domain-containing protein [bacterium]|nr:methyltransferase domain-containing protein [bacterium]
MASDYVHGYSAREAERLHDQASTLRELLHHDSTWPPGSLVLEAGTGVGATTAIVSGQNPAVRFVSLDFAGASLAQARAELGAAGLRNVSLTRGDLYRLPFPDAAFDHVFLCFVLEHLTRPPAALGELIRVLKPGGTLTAVEGDHGSCYFHPETPAARAAWECLIRVQAALGGDSLIGRRLQPLLRGAGLREVRVSPRMVYCDAARPQWLDGFVMRTIIPMVEGVREEALARGYIDADTWARGIADLHATGTAPEGTFCYAFFKGMGVK